MLTLSTHLLVLTKSISQILFNWYETNIQLTLDCKRILTVISHFGCLGQGGKMDCHKIWRQSRGIIQNIWKTGTKLLKLPPKLNVFASQAYGLSSHHRLQNNNTQYNIPKGSSRHQIIVSVSHFNSLWCIVFLW